MESTVVATHDNTTNKNNAKMLRLACTFYTHVNESKRVVTTPVQRKYESRECVNCVKLPVLHRDDDDELEMMLPLLSATFTALAVVAAVATSCIHLLLLYAPESFELITRRAQKLNQTPNRDENASKCTCNLIYQQWMCRFALYLLHMRLCMMPFYALTLSIIMLYLLCCAYAMRGCQMTIAS